MSFLRSISRYMERNQAASRAMIKQVDQASITDMDDMSDALWLTIKDSVCQAHCLMILNDQVVSFDFIVRLLIKMGFECEHSVRLMMALHSDGSVILAKADKDVLLALQDYMNEQAKKHGVSLLSEIVEV